MPYFANLLPAAKLYALYTSNFPLSISIKTSFFLPTFYQHQNFLFLAHFLSTSKLPFSFPLSANLHVCLHPCKWLVHIFTQQTKNLKSCFSHTVLCFPIFQSYLILILPFPSLQFITFLILMQQKQSVSLDTFCHRTRHFKDANHFSTDFQIPTTRILQIAVRRL